MARHIAFTVADKSARRLASRPMNDLTFAGLQARLPWLLFVCLAILLFSTSSSAQIGPPLTPVIGIEPPLLDFGAVSIGRASEASIRLSNLLSDPRSVLELTNLEVSGPGFSIEDAPVLPIRIPGDRTSVPIALRFTPESVGLVTGALRITGRAVNSPLTVPLSGRGVLTEGPTTIVASWDFSADSLSFAQKDTFEVAQLGGLTTILADSRQFGLPSVPVLTTQLLLPRDRRIREVTYRAVPEPQGRHLLYPIQRVGTLDGRPQPDFVPPDQAAYSSPIPFRSTIVEVVHETWYRGYRLATINVYPLQFVGATTTVILNTRIDATFFLESMPEADLELLAPKLRPDFKASFRDGVRRAVARRVANPEALAFYRESSTQGRRAYGGFTPSERPSLDSPPVEYVIVTSTALAESFKPLADWKTRSGMPAVIRTTQWIDERYAGLDLQERIRNFIRDSYSKWGTNYVLVGGDTEVVPDRFFHVQATSQDDPNFQDPPVDYYYAALDGNWNADADSAIGEPVGDGGDLFHEVMVARAPVNTSLEASTFVDKVLTYARAPGTHDIIGTHYNSLLLLGGSTNSFDDYFANGIWVAESIEDAVGAKTAEIMAPPPTVRRLYENVFFDADGPCRSTDGDFCQSDAWGFKSLTCSNLGSGRVRVRIAICTDNDAANRFELSVAPGSGFTFPSATASQGQWTVTLRTDHRIVWTRSGPQAPNTCEGGLETPSYEFDLQGCANFHCFDDCDDTLLLTEELYLDSQLVFQGQEARVEPCLSGIFTDIRDFLCGQADSSTVFAQSRANEFNETGVLGALGQGYGYVFHQEHSYTDRLGGPSNAAHACCVESHHPSPPLPTTRGVVSGIDSGHEYGIFYSIGSYQNSIDKDAVSEALMRVPAGGAVAYLAQQRSSHEFLRWLVANDFFVNCFDRVQFRDLASAAYSAMETGAQRPHRDTTVELLLLGDPAMPLFSDVPQTLTLAGSGLNAITSLGQRTLEFTVTQGATPVSGALVCVTQDSTGTAIGELLYKFVETDPTGMARLDVSIENDADLQVTATARNGKPRVVTVPVSRDPAAPDVFYADQTLVGALNDGQDRARAGYSGTLRLSVENRGGGIANNVSGILTARGTVTFNLLVDVPGDNPDQGLVALTDRVFIGPGLRNPPTVPFTFQQLATAGIEPDGIPSIPPTKWGYFVWRQTNDRKWYIRWRGDVGGEVFVGEIRSSGGFTVVEETQPFETLTDTLRCEAGQCQSGDRVVIFHTVTPSGDEDGIRVQAINMRNLQVTGDDNQSFGNIPAGGTATADFTIEVRPEAEDRHEALMELELNQGGPPLHLSLFTVPLTAPKLTVVRQTVSLVVGTTYRLDIRVRNRGTADAENVTVRIENEQGATVVDGVRVLGRLRAGLELEARDLRIQAADKSSVRLRVILENRYGTGQTISWTQTGVDIVEPPPPAAVKALPGAGGAMVTWEALRDRVPPPDSTVAGYNVYRREDGTDDRPRVNDSLVVGTALFFDDFSFNSFGLNIGILEEWPYWYSVTAVDSSWNESKPSDPEVQTTMWLAELPGWPKQIDVATEGSVLVEDIDADQDLELLYAGRAVFAWHHNGTEVVDGDSNPTTDGVFFDGFGQVGDTILESGRRFMNDLAAIPGLVVGSTWGGRVYFWNAAGQRIGGPCNPCTVQGGSGFASPVIKDLDLDGNPEIVVSSHTGWLYRWTYMTATGQIATQRDSVRLYTGSFNWGGPAVGNIDGDPQLEILYPTRQAGGRIFAVDNSLNQQWVYGPITDPNESPFPSTPTLANVDGDAMMEAIVAFSPNLVAVVDNTGTAISPWPEPIGPLIGNGERLPSPLVADILGTATPEVVVGDGQGSATVNVNVYNMGGTSAASWHLEYIRDYEAGIKGVRSPISLVDVDEDSEPEVMHGTDLHHVVLWNPETGTLEPGWPIVVRESVKGKVTVADLDNLGKQEVVASDMAGLIHVWDYRDQMGIGIPETPAFTLQDRLGPNRPNPFNPLTLIPFELSRRGNVSLRVYSPTGRLLREIASGVRDPGRYGEAWDGRDDEGHALPSGVYLSELRVDGKAIGSWKLLLLR